MKRPAILLLLAAVLCVPWGPAQAAEDDHGADHAPPGAAEGALERGVHGGQLLEQGDVTLELAIHERGVPPEYRAWISRAGEAVETGAELTVALTRLGGRVDRFSFTWHGDYWRGDGIVEEPHSFDVAVTLGLDGRRYDWAWPSHEGRTEIDADVADAAGVATRKAGAATIERTIVSYGRLVPDEDRIARVTGRFDGVVERVSARLGDSVAAGDALATIESSDSLQSYALRAPISGTITARNVNVGELSDGRTLFVISALDTLWAELKVFPGQRAGVEVGAPLRLGNGEQSRRSAIAHLLPSAADAVHVLARAPIDNRAGLLSPGQLVRAEIVVEVAEVPLAVDNRALQTFRDWTVVFIRVGDTFEIRPLELGRSDGRFTEVLSGLDPGDAYVVENSYLVKADIEKSGASHDH